MITSSSTESLKGTAFLSKMLGILAFTYAQLVADVNMRYHSLTQNLGPAPSMSDIDFMTMSAPSSE